MRLDNKDGLTYWNELAKANPEDCFVVYTGKLTQAQRQGTIMNWKEFGSLIRNIQKQLGVLSLKSRFLF